MTDNLSNTQKERERFQGIVASCSGSCPAAGLVLASAEAVRWRQNTVNAVIMISLCDNIRRLTPPLHVCSRYSSAGDKTRGKTAQNLARIL